MNSPSVNSTKLPASQLLPLYLLALLKLAIHLSINAATAYGYFRDEFYYLACSDHLAWGYVDQPPLSIFLLRISRFLFGDSLFALRLLPAFSGAMVVFMTGIITRELGGKKFAQITAACAVFAAPIFLAYDSVYSMNCFETLFWTLGIYYFIRIIKQGKTKDWIILGIVLGLGTMNKISVLWLCAGIVAGLLCSPLRKELLTLKFWSAAGLILAIFTPYLIWQFPNNFASWEFIKNISSGKYVALSPIQFYMQQISMLNPFSLPIWVTGFIFLLFSKKMKQFRPLGITYLTVAVILLSNNTSKPNYMTPIYPILFAAGAVAIEMGIERIKQLWLKSAVPALLLIGGVIAAPIVLAILPVETYINYAKALGEKPATSEKNGIGKLPQFYADMFGWDNMVAQIAKAYNSLTPEEKAKCVILMNNYGEAGAVDLLGPKYGLPKAISGHNNYWLWGCNNSKGEIVLRIGVDMNAVLESYRSAEQVGTISDPYCMPYENNISITICRDRKIPLKDDWGEFKVYN